jgi:hypothetical protein
MLRALARFSLVLIGFWAISYFMKWSILLALIIGCALGFMLAFYGWWQEKTSVYTARALNAKPFEGKIPQSIADSIATSPALRGDDSYSQKVVGSSAFEHNFKDLLQYAQLQDGQLLEVQSALVAEPANPNSNHAVAVSCGGVILGYIPEFESESLYSFLLNRRGVARVNSNIYFDLQNSASRVELDSVRPYEVVIGV